MKRFSTISLLLLSSCTVGPDYKPPEVKMPEKWQNQENPTQCQNLSQQDIRWWQQFNDRDLDQLITESASSNLDIQSALEKIRQARAAVAVAYANLLPSVDGIGSYTRRHSSKNSTGGSISVPTGTVSPVGGGSSGGGGAPNIFVLGFETNWEIDLFGGLRRAEEAAYASFQSSIEAGRATHLALITEIAQNYINLRYNQQTLLSLQEQVNLWEKYLKLKKDLLRSGLTDETDMNAAQLSLDQTKAQIPPIESAIKTILHQLALLLGKEPWYLYERFREPVLLIPPSLEQTLSPGLPATLLQQRPDIRQAERDLAANTANIGVSVATLFPAINFVGNYGVTSNTASKLFKEDSQGWTLTPSFSVPLIDFGKIKAQIDQAKALQTQSLLSYKKLILSALGDVETSLVALREENSRSQSLYQAAQVAQKTYDLAKDKQSAGLNTQLDVYTAQINWLIAQQNYRESQTTQALNLVNLYKALGGGWNTFGAFKGQDRTTPLQLSSAIGYLLD